MANYNSAYTGTQIDTAVGYNINVTSDVQAQLNAKEPTVTKGDLTEDTSAVLTIGGGTNAVIGSGVTIEVKQANSGQSGYLSSTDWSTFNNKQDSVSGAASTITSSDLTTSRAVVSDGSGKIAASSITSTELGYLDDVSSNIQTQLNAKEDALTKGDLTEDTSAVLTIGSGANAVIGSGTTIQVKQSTSGQSGYLSSTDWTTFNNKQDEISGAASTITSSDLDTDKALLSNSSGKVAASSISNVELGYLSGVSSNIQDQINDVSSPESTTLSGTANQISLSESGTDVLLGATPITLSLPQDIHSGATPNFVGVNLSGLTADRALASDGSKNVSSSSVTSTELGYLQGATSNIQTQIDNVTVETSDLSGTANQINLSTSGSDVLVGATPITLSLPQDIHSGASPSFAGTNLSGLTASRVIQTDGSKNLESSAVTNTELGYISGVTSAVQTQLNSKEPTLTKGNLTESTSNVLNIAGGTSSQIGSGTTIEVQQSSASQDGYLSQEDWITFNSKAAAYDTTDIIGTSNQVILSGDGTGMLVGTTPLTISLPQDINVASTPVFAGLQLDNLADGRVIITESNQLASSAVTATELGYLDGVTSNVQTQIDNIDADQIVSGTINIARIPAAALERLTNVADQAARYALTTNEVQNGDTVRENDTGLMYIVVDDSNLDNASGYQVYTAGSAASVPWSGVTDTPTTISGYGITDGQTALDFTDLIGTANQIVLSGDGSGMLVGTTPITLSLPQNIHTGASPTFTGVNLSGLTADRVATTDGSKNISSSSVTSTELGYVSGVTSAIQTQINSKEDTIVGAASTITSSDLTGDRAIVSNGSGKVAVSNITSTELNYLDGVTSNIQTQIDNVAIESSDLSGTTNQINLSPTGSNILVGSTPVTLSLPQDIHSGASPDFAGMNLSGTTADRVLTTNSSKDLTSSSITTTELGYLSGLSENVQAKLNQNAESADLSGTADQITVSYGTDVLVGSTPVVLSLPQSIATDSDVTFNQATLSGLTASRALVSDGSNVVSSSAVTGTELGYVSGVTSAIQTQLNAKEPTVTKGDVTESTSDVFIFSGNTNAVIGSGLTIEMKEASNLQDGYLSKEDWSNFNASGGTIDTTDLSVDGNFTLDPNGSGILVGSTPVSLNLVQDITVASTPVFAGLKLNNLTSNRAIITDSNNELSTTSVTDVELGYVSGVTSSVQTQLNSKEPTVTKGNLTEDTSSVLTISGGTSSVIGSGVTIQVKEASSGQSGYLSSSDWTAFNSKQDSIETSDLSGTADQVDVSYGTDVLVGSTPVVLSLPQSISTSSSPQFTGMNLSGLTADRVNITDGSKNISSSSVTATELGYVSGVTSAIQTQINSKEPTLTKGDLTESTSDVLTLAGNTSAIIGSGLSIQVKQSGASQDGYLSQADWNTFNNKQATVETNNLLGTTNQVSLSSDGSNIILGATPITLSLPQDIHSGATVSFAGANLSGLTADRALISDGSKNVANSSVTSTELGYVSGVTSSIQTQINSKQATITGGATTIVSSNLTSDRAVISDGSGKVAVSSVTADEVGYLDGVSSNIQTQLDSKQGTISTSDLSGTANQVSVTANSGVLVGTTPVTISLEQDIATSSSPQFAGINLTGTTADRAVVTDGSKNISTSAVTSTELGYVSGVTSAIQTQINSKEDTLTKGDLTETTSSVLNLSGNTNAVIGSGLGIEVKQSGSTQSGYLSQDDWNTFNAKSSAFDSTDLSGTTNQVNLNIDGTGAILGSTPIVLSLPQDINVAATPVFAGLQLDNLTNNRVIINDNNQLATSNVTNTELGYLSGVTSGIQNQINNIDADQITSGTINIARIPAAALERLTNVANEAARFALTTNEVQNGDTVRENDTGLMYIVVDDSNLDNSSGYQVYTAGTAASVAWSGVTGTPTTLSGYGITDGQTALDFTDVNDGTSITITGETSGIIIGTTPITIDTVQAIDTSASPQFTSLNLSGLTASRAMTTDGSKNIVSSSVTDTELGYVSGVTSAIQTQLNSKEPTVTKGNLTESTSDVLTISGGTNAIIGSGSSIQVKQAGASQDGYLSQEDWNTFNDKGEVTNTSSLTGTANQVTLSAACEIVGSTPVVLSLPQDLNSGASVTFAGANLSGLTADRALISDGSKNVSSSSVTSTELGYVSGVTSALQTQLNAKEPTLTKGDFTESTSNILTINGGTNAIIGSGLSVQVQQSSSSQDGYLSQEDWSTFNSKQSTITTSNLSGTTNQINLSSEGTGIILGSTPITLSLPQNIDTSATVTFAGANLSGLTADRATITDGSKNIASSSVTSTELGYVSGVTSSIQTQINSKEDTIVGAATTITSSDLTSDRALVANGSGKVGVSDVTATELSYLDGVTSSVQTQLDAKQDNITTSDLSGTANQVSVTANSGVLVGSTPVTISLEQDIATSSSPQFAGLNLTGLTASRVMQTDGSKNVSSSSVTNTELGYVSGVTSAIQTQLNSKEPTLTKGDLTESTSDVLTLAGNTSAVIGSGLTVQVKQAGQTQDGYLSSDDWNTFNNKGELTNTSALTGTSNQVILSDTCEIVGSTPVVLSLPQDISTSSSVTFAGANLSGLTASRVLVSDGSKNVSSSSVTGTELGYVSGVTSAIQTQINSKQDTINGAASTITSSDLTIDRTVISNGSGKIAVSDITSTELNYLDGVTSNIQTQLDAKEGSLTTSDLSGTVNQVSVTANSGILVGSTPVTISLEQDIATSSSPEFTGLTLSGLTSSRALVADGSNNVSSSAVTSTELGYVSGVTSAIQTQLNAKEPTLTKGDLTESTSSVLTISGGTNAVIGSGSSIQVKKATSSQDGYLDQDDWETFNSKQDSINTSTLSGTTNQISLSASGTDVLVGSTPITLSLPQDIHSGASVSFAGANFSGLTADRVVITDGSKNLSSSATTSTELGYVSGVTSSIQTQINSKEDTIVGAASTITSSDLTSDRALVSNGSGKVGVSDITATEINYLDGVTSNIQTQLDSKEGSITTSDLSGTANQVSVTANSGVLVGSTPVTISLEQDIATSSSPQFTGMNLTGLTADRAMVTDGSKNMSSSSVTATELGYVSGVTSAIQTQLNAKEDTLTKGNLTESTSDVLTISGGTNAVIGSGSSIQVKQSSSSQDGYLSQEDWSTFNSKANSYETSDLSGTANQVNISSGGTNVLLGSTPITLSLPQDVHSGASPNFAGVNLSGLTASRALVSDGSKNVSSSSVTSTELGYVSGVTSAIQTQINNIDASQVNSGTLDIARIPAAALERLTNVADEAARFALTTNEVQNGDTVRENDTGLMYIVVDDSNLDNSSGYQVYTAGTAASVAWSGVTGKPTTLSGFGITDGQVALDFTDVNDGTGITITGDTEGIIVGTTPITIDTVQAIDTSASPQFTGLNLSGLTASRALVTDGSKNIGSSAVTGTELGYVSGVTSAIQTQINSKEDTIIGAASTITSSDLTGDRALISNGSGKVAVSAVTSTEVGYLDGVTSNIQSQLDAKEGSITTSDLSGTANQVSVTANSGVLVGSTPVTISLEQDIATSSSPQFTGLNLSGLTASRVLQTDGSKNIESSSVTNTELGYVSGVTSAIQTQLNAKEPTLTKGNLTETTSDVLTISGGTNAIIGSGLTLQVKQASSSQDGYLSQEDWTTFNNKQSTVETTNLIGTTNQVTLSGGDGTNALVGSTPITLSLPQSIATSSSVTFAGLNLSGLTADRVAITDGSKNMASSAVTSTELGYVSGVTSAIQTQINSKQDTINGAATTITSSDLTSDRAVISNGSGKIAISDVTSTELSYLDGVTSNIQTQLDSKEGTLTTSDLSGTANQVSVTANSGVLVGSTPVTISLEQDIATSSSPQFTGLNLSGLTASRALVSDGSKNISVSSVTSTELGYVSGVTSSVQTQINAKEDTIIGAATTITSSDLDTDRALISNGTGKVAVSAVTSTELGYLDGVTSNVQTQLDAKEGSLTTSDLSGTANQVSVTANSGVLVGSTPVTISLEQDIATSSSPQFTGLNLSGLTASRVLQTDGSKNLESASVTTTELGYVSGVTSAIQTQLNAKEPTLTKGDLTEDTSSVLTIGSGSNAVIGSGTTIQVKQATSGQSGYLSSSDWTTFNNKQDTIETSDLSGTADQITVTANSGVLVGSTPVTLSLPQSIATTSEVQFGKMGINKTIEVDKILSLGSDTYVEIGNFSSSDTADNGTFVNSFRSRNTVNSPSIVSDDDLLYAIFGYGYDGAAYQLAAGIRMKVDGTPGSNDMPGRLEFLTTPDGSTSASVRMMVDNTGNVGIGTENPSYKLDIAASNTDATTNGSRVTATNYTTSSGTYHNTALELLVSDSYVASGQTNSGSFNGASVNAYITNASHQGTLTTQRGVFGSAGIDSCGSSGAVTNASAIFSRLYNNDADGTMTNAHLYYGEYSGSSGTITNRWGLYLTGEAKNYISNNIGLGTTDIESWDTGWRAIEFYGSAILGSNTSDVLVFASNAYFASSAWYYKANGAASDFYLASGEAVWRTAGTGNANDSLTWSEKMKLDNNGNLGIGTTPDSWEGSFTAIDLGTTGSVSHSTTYINIAENAYYDTTDSRWEYKTDGESSIYQSGNGYHSLYVAASGTANNAITWITAMTIDPTGTTCFGSNTSYIATEQVSIYNTGQDNTLRIQAADTYEAWLKLGVHTDNIWAMVASDSDTLNIRRWSGSAYENVMTFDSNKNVGIGMTANTNELLAIGSDNYAQQAFYSGSDTQGNGTYIISYRMRNNISSPAIVADDDYILSIIGYGYDGSNSIPAAAIRMFVDGTPGTDDMPGRLEFQTTNDGASQPSIRMTIDNAGQIGINRTTYLGNWDSAFSAIDFGASSISNYKDSNDIWLGVNVYYGSNAWRQKETGTATLTLQTDDYFVSRFVASQSQGTAITWIEPFKVQIDGIYLTKPLLLGTTDIESYVSNYEVIQFPESAIYASTTNTSFIITSNTYNDGEWKYRSTGKAAYYEQYDGTHVFVVAPSAVASTPVTWTNALIIDNDANTGIGMTPEYGTLDVSGFAGFFNGNIDIFTEKLRLGRSDSPSIRYHSISSRSSSTDSDNRIGFAIHDGTTTTSQKTVLELYGDGLVKVPDGRVELYRAISDANILNLYSQATLTVTSTASISVKPIQGALTGSIVETGVTNNGAMTAIHGAGYVQSSSHQGTFAEQNGGLFEAGIYTCGTGGSVTASYGVRSVIHNRDSDGTITSSYLFYGDVQGTDGTITNNWGLYLDGCDKNYIEGNVGIDSLPRTWSTSYTALQLGGNACFSHTTSEGASGSLAIGQNVFIDAVTGWEYISTDEASLYQQVSGTHVFYVAASGTAGNAVSWGTAALTIDNSGYIGIGNTPYASTQVHVYADKTDVNFDGIRCDIQSSITSTATKYNSAVNAFVYDYQVASGETNNGYVRGLNATVYIDNASHQGTLANQYAGYFDAGILNCGSGGTITNSYAVYSVIDCDDSDGTITNAYLFRGTYSHSLGTITHKWGLYIDSVVKNYIDGYTQIANSTAPTTAPANMGQIWSEDINGTAGKAGLHMMAESGTDKLVINGTQIKTDTGDPSNVHEGKLVINTFDNNVKIYADSGWRQIASW